MRRKIKNGYVIFIVITSMIFLLSKSPVIMSAQLAGEEGTIPVSSESGKKNAKPASVNTAVKKVQAPMQKENETIETFDDAGRPNNATDDGTQYVTIDFDNVDIQVFIKFISELTGKNFIFDETLLSLK